MENTITEVCEKCGGEGVIIEDMNVNGEHGQYEEVCECQLKGEEEREEEQ